MYITNTRVYITPSIVPSMLKGIYFKVSAKDKIKAAAKADDRTMGDWIRHLVSKQLEAMNC